MGKQENGQLQKWLESVAYHEAGHAVAAYDGHIKMVGVSIVPDGNSSGRVRHRLPRLKTYDYDGSDRNVRHMERVIRTLLAGGTAQRRFNPRGFRNYHCASDNEKAVEFVSKFVGSERELNAYLRLLYIQTEQLLETLWPQVEILAQALLERTALSGKEAWGIIERSVSVPGPRSD